MTTAAEAFAASLASKEKHRAAAAAAAVTASTYKDRKRRLVLKVDVREANKAGFMECLRRMLAERGLSDRLVVEQLNLFDFVFALMDTPTEMFGPGIELKLLSDLSQSIRDGRFREQKARMAALDLPADKKIIIVQGRIPRVGESGPAGSHLISAKALHGAVVKPAMRGESTSVLTDDFEATAVYLVEWLMYLEHVDDPTEVAHMSYVDCVQSQVRKSDFRDENRLALMLSGFVQNVSPAVAKAIVAVYPTIGALQLAYLRDPRGTRDRIAALEVEGRTTRVGPAVAARIEDVFDIGLLRTEMATGAPPEAAPKRTAAAPKKKAKKVRKIEEDGDDE